MTLINRYKEQKGSSVNEVDWLVEEMCKVDGSVDFIYASREVLNKKGDDLVWWVGMIDKYNNHPDLLMPSLRRTRVHFKNIAMSYLHKSDFKAYRVWIRNWSDLLAICRYLDPEWVAEEEFIAEV
jgi:hypothetical protein